MDAHGTTLNGMTFSGDVSGLAGVLRPLLVALRGALDLEHCISSSIEEMETATIRALTDEYSLLSWLAPIRGCDSLPSPGPP